MLPPISKSVSQLHEETGVFEQSLYKWKDPSTPLEDQRPMAIRPEAHNKISPEVQQEIMKVSNSNKYKDLSPHQIVPRLLDEEERYIASESTMYRVLRQADMMHHRGVPKKQNNVKSQLIKQQDRTKCGCGILLGFHEPLGDFFLPISYLRFVQ